MQRLVVLIGKNREGPWVFTGRFAAPVLHIEGATGRLTLEQTDSTVVSNILPENEVELSVLENGKHSISARRFSRIRRDCSSDILCLITSV